MARKTSRLRSNASDDTPIKRAAQEIAAARSKARKAAPNRVTLQKRVTRSSGLAKPHDEDVPGVTIAKKPVGRPSKAAPDQGGSRPKATPKRRLSKKAARAPRARRGSQGASSEEEAPDTAKKAKAADENESSDEENRPGASNGSMDEKSDGGGDGIRQLERKLRIAEGRCC